MTPVLKSSFGFKQEQDSPSPLTLLSINFPSNSKSSLLPWTLPFQKKIPLDTPCFDSKTSPSLTPPNRIQNREERLSWRWVVLSLSCCLLFGNYYAYDLPASLNTYLLPHLNLSYKNWQLILNCLYSVYSLPNTILPLLGGSLLDKYDPRFILLGFCGCICLGQIVFSVGVQFGWIWLMILGRVLFGIGGESVGVVQSWIVAEWFKLS